MRDYDSMKVEKILPIKALEIPLDDIIRKYSNPEKAQQAAHKFLGSSSVLFKSTKKNKKYMVLAPTGRWVHFGQLPYEDFTFHQDKERRKRYLMRAMNIKGDWRDNKFSPNNLAIHILW